MELLVFMKEELVEPIAKVLLNLGVKKRYGCLWSGHNGRKITLVQKQQYVKLKIVKQVLRN